MSYDIINNLMKYDNDKQELEMIMTILSIYDQD